MVSRSHDRIDNILDTKIKETTKKDKGEMMEKQSTQKRSSLKTIFILLALAFISQSIVYLLRGLPISQLTPNFTFFYTARTNIISFDKIIGAIFFVTIFGGLAITYFKILKKRESLFQTKNEMAKFILVVAIIFFVMLPLTSTDVFYYMGTGWSQAKYGVNPYYTSVKEIMEEQEKTKQEADRMLYRTPAVWRGTTIVYGPVWPLVCKVLSGLSGGNVALGLFIYKLFNLLIYLATCYIIFKLTKKKKLCTLLYALNPLVLFDGLANVHNDLLVVFLMVLALYFFYERRKCYQPFYV